MEREQFTFYASFFRAISRIRKASDRCAAYDAICAFALLGEEPDIDSLPDAAAIAYEVAKPILEASNRKAENGKQGGSKTKQTGSKPEANQKQTPSEAEANAKQGEVPSKNKDKNKDKCLIPPVSPPDDFPPVLAEAFSDWLAYKKERRETYKETGLKNLSSQIRSAAGEYGAEAVAKVIRTSIASNYQGIVFDRLERTAPPKPAPAPDSFPYNDPELARLKRI